MKMSRCLRRVLLDQRMSEPQRGGGEEARRLAARQTLPCKMHITQETGAAAFNEDSTSNPTPLSLCWGGNILERKTEGTVGVQATSVYLLRGLHSMVSKYRLFVYIFLTSS